MIRRTEIAEIGTVCKTHGLRGELSVELDDDIDTACLDHVVMCIDGIYVPFRIASQRPRGNRGLLLTLDGLESADAAAPYAGHELFALLRELPENDEMEESDDEGLYAEDLEGFTLTGPDGNAVLGTIETVDTTTMNTLLHVALSDGRNVLVPLADDWIVSLDTDTRTIAMDIPDTLLNETY